MARRTFDVPNVTEILVHWDAGRSQSEIATSLGLDRKTVKKYLTPAIEAGLEPGGGRTQAEWSVLVRDWFPRLADTTLRQYRWPLIEQHRDYIVEQLEAGVTKATIHQRLRDEHDLQASVASLKRWIAANLPEQALRSKVTVLGEDPAPGSEGQIDYGYLGTWLDPIGGRRRRVWGFVMVLCCSRHLFLRPVLRMDQLAWTPHRGVPLLRCSIATRARDEASASTSGGSSTPTRKWRRRSRPSPATPFGGTGMTGNQPPVLNRDQVWQVIDTQQRSLANLLDDLSDDEWRRPSLCTGWTVRDVAAHLTLQQLGVGDVIAMMAQWRGNLDRTIQHAARRRAAALPTEEIIAEIRGMVGSQRATPSGSRTWRHLSTSSSTPKTSRSRSAAATTCRRRLRPSLLHECCPCAGRRRCFPRPARWPGSGSPQPTRRGPLARARRSMDR